MCNVYKKNGNSQKLIPTRVQNILNISNKCRTGYTITNNILYKMATLFFINYANIKALLPSPLYFDIMNGLKSESNV